MKMLKTFLVLNFLWVPALLAQDGFLLPKKHLSPGISSRKLTKFDSAKLLDSSFVDAKRSARKSIIDRAVKQRSRIRLTTTAGFEGLDQDLEYFLQKPSSQILSNLNKIEEAKLNEGRVQVQPWSDTYWPLYKGALGNRYADPDFEQAGQDSFKKYLAYIQQREHRFPDFIANVQDETDPRLQRLSPSEKYDLLIGDEKATLTQKMWSEGIAYSEGGREVETWMGLCHGWAPAAFVDLRARKVVKVPEAKGKKVLTFYPSDIKGLVTTLWAYSNYETVFMGGRCNLKNPERDSNGRVKDPECWDIHPGIWHLAVVNKIGVEKKSFVMDATWDYEVWNQPIVSYDVDYINPVTREHSKSFEKVAIAVESYPQDKFKKFRNSKTKKIVAVVMRIDYLSETAPSHDTTDSESNDAIVGVNYRYDLELDNQNNVIGGEWQDFAHPDFLWAPMNKAFAWAEGDARLREQWNGVDAVPTSYIQTAPGSSQYGQPLGKVVRKLLERAQ